MNIYKPRYKIAFQAKNKVWPYKDSRLRRFFNIRGRKLVRRGFFKRYVTVHNNMKWTIARRYIRPYMRRRKAVRRRFRNAFYSKQQLRAFHGKIKEEKFRNFFRKYLTHGVNRNMSFFAALERRLDIFFFRMRLLPTIFACHQYILHHGVILNKGVEYCPSALVRPGDKLTVSQAHWRAIYHYLKERILYRLHGKRRMLKRKYKKIKKKTWWIRSTLRATALTRYILRKRKYLDLYLQKRRVHFLKSLHLFGKFAHTLWNWPLGQTEARTLHLRKTATIFYIQLQKIYRSFKHFMSLERQRKKIFYIQWKKFRFKFVKVVKNWKWKKKKKLLRQRQRLRVKKVATFKSLDKYRARNKKMYVHFVYLLKSISSTYLNLLSLMLKLRLMELHFYRLLFISLKENNILVKSRLKIIVKARQKTLVLTSVYIRKNIIAYYQAFFRRFFRIETRKSFYKDISIYIPKKKLSIKKRVPSGNSLTYFLIRRRFRIRRNKRIPRLKEIHWALPKYIYMDFKTLRAVFLYSPGVKEINYSFKCSLPKIVSFYKSLAL